MLLVAVSGANPKPKAKGGPGANKSPLSALTLAGKTLPEKTALARRDPRPAASASDFQTGLCYV